MPGSGEGSVGQAFIEGGKKGMAGGGAGRASIEVDGQRVPLSPEGIERAQREGVQVGKGLADAVRAAVEHADGK
jgi:hypothetical protein